MTEGTAAFLARLREKTGPQKTVWCQHGKALGWNNDEHQVCLDQGAAYEKRYPGQKWSCPCKCHK